MGRKRPASRLVIMANQSVFSSEKVHLVDARILAFSIGHSQENYFNSDDLISTEFRVHSEESLNRDDRLIRIILRFDVDALVQAADEGKVPEEIRGLGAFHLGFAFVVDNFDELVKTPSVSDESYQIDSVLGSHLLAISYSTARGMILVKTTGTVLEGAILPIIDPAELMGLEQA